jgi:serine phosphatase RsbU (regulator of sigma subunit)
VLTVIFGPLILVPGLAVAAVRLHWHSEQFRTRMVGKLFTSMRQELKQARHIHESMFPARHDDGFVRFDFTFRPMHELGGDFIHLHVGPTGLVYVTLLDVTGHGLAAALTVNRLYGELERVRAESPHAEPGELLAALNRYIYFTMSRHQIFVTAVCLSIDPYIGRLQWASAGHPPGFRRGANGVVTQLPATTVLLGALGPEEFLPEQRALDLTPGDTIILYTDGAFEARDRQGNQLGIPRLEDLLTRHPPPRNWSQHLESAVVKHSGGQTADDVLIASLTLVALRKESLVEPMAVAS